MDLFCGCFAVRGTGALQNLDGDMKIIGKIIFRNNDISQDMSHEVQLGYKKLLQIDFRTTKPVFRSGQHRTFCLRMVAYTPDPVTTVLS